MNKEERRCSLVAGQIEWLTKMTTRFSLSNDGKAFRCCLNWAAQTQAAKPSESIEGCNLISLVATTGQVLESLHDDDYKPKLDDDDDDDDDEYDSLDSAQPHAAHCIVVGVD